MPLVEVQRTRNLIVVAYAALALGGVVDITEPFHLPAVLRFAAEIPCCLGMYLLYRAFVSPFGQRFISGDVQLSQSEREAWSSRLRVLTGIFVTCRWASRWH